MAAVASTAADLADSTGADLAGFTVAGSTVAGSTMAGSTTVDFHDNRFFFGGSFAYPWWGYYPDYGYYDYSQPYSSQTWYYCSDPAGYYPYVTQCNTGWQAVPAS